MESSAWQELVAQLPPDLPEKIERQVKKWNRRVRDALRQGMAVRLADAGAGTQVPIRISGSEVPAGVEDIPDAWLLPWVPTLKQLSLTASDVRDRLVPQLLNHLFSGRNFTPGAIDPRRYRDALDILVADTDALLKRAAYAESLARQILNQPSDVLGAYFPRQAKIEIYPEVIGVVAMLINVDPLDLTVTTLIHELAHAYSHLGLDTSGTTWHTNNFIRTSTEVIEGLAQYYTDQVLLALGPEGNSIRETFLALLAHQPLPYRTHLIWDRFQPEVVRSSMLEARTGIIDAPDVFLTSLLAADERLAGGMAAFFEQSPIPGELCGEYRLEAYPLSNALRWWCLIVSSTDPLKPAIYPLAFDSDHPHHSSQLLDGLEELGVNQFHADSALISILRRVSDYKSSSD